MKKIIYFPSLSVGNPYTTLTNNFTYKNGTSCRFYDKELVPDEFYHPYFLITGGHYYKSLDIREKFGIPLSSLVMGDSGGFQIATGALKYSKELVHQIFTWLETISDIAINLDIPPRTNQRDTFNEKLDISYDNFKYFYENQTGKTKFLNVLQGGDIHLYYTWYNKVKDFEFKGWSVGSSNSIKKLISAIVILIDNKEHLKSNNEYFHILGSTRFVELAILIKLQKLFEENNINIQITTDSSTPSIMGAFGGWINNFSYNKLKYNSIGIPKLGNYDKGTQIPISTNFDKKVLLNNITFDEIIKYKSNGYISVILHNFYFILDVLENLHYILYSDKLIQEQILDKDIMKLLDIIEEIFYSNDPISIYKKYETLLMTYDKDSLSNNFLNEKTTEFFEF